MYRLLKKSWISSISFDTLNYKFDYIMILLMEKNPANQLRLQVSPTIYDGFFTSKWLADVSRISSINSIYI